MPCLKVMSLLLVLSLQTAAQVVSTPSLEPNRPLERAINGGEVHPYNLTLKVGEYARVEADQRGIDLALWTFDPSGKKIAEVKVL